MARDIKGQTLPIYGRKKPAGLSSNQYSSTDLSECSPSSIITSGTPATSMQIEDLQANFQEKRDSI